MSYSFSVTAPTKAEALDLVGKKFDEIVSQQPIHSRDREAAIAAATAMVALIVDDPEYHVTINVNGYVGWRDQLKDDSSNDLTAASVGASASLFKPVAE